MENLFAEKNKIISDKNMEQELTISCVRIPSEVATMDKNNDPILEKLMCAD